MDITDFTIQSVSNYQVRPRDGRWLSQNQDAMHFVDSREYITITDSVCEGMGDDALNYAIKSTLFEML